MADKPAPAKPTLPAPPRTYWEVAAMPYQSGPDGEPMSFKEGWEPFSSFIRAAGGTPIILLRRKVAIKEDGS